MKKIVIISGVVLAVGAGLVLLATNHMEHGAQSMTSGNSSSEMSEASVEAAQSPHSTVDTKRDDSVFSIKEDLSYPVRVLVCLNDEKQNYNSMGRAIAQLSKDLSAADVTALRDMLTWPNDKFPEGMRDIEINAVKNDILDRLLRQTTLPEGIGLQLVEMASNSDNDPVWRDYCVQFMTPCYERLTTEYSESTDQTTFTAEAKKGHEGSNNSTELKAIHDAMFAALNERDSTIAGTSLIGLELLSRTHDEFDRESIQNSSLELAADELASPSCRLTALRLAAGFTTEGTEGHEGLASDSSVSSSEASGEMNPEVAETARLIAQTGETVLLRSAAIVTLGEAGSTEDRELLESYTLADNSQIADAARIALQKMDARNL